MLHLLPIPETDQDTTAEARPTTVQPYAEALARLASIRHALRMVDPFGGGPASDDDECDDNGPIAEAWTTASKAQSRLFDSRTGRTASAAAAALDALLAEQGAGRGPNSAAGKQIADEIRLGLEDVSRLMLR
jgi:hypothetical protein